MRKARRKESKKKKKEKKKEKAKGRGKGKEGEGGDGKKEEEAGGGLTALAGAMGGLAMGDGDRKPASAPQEGKKEQEQERVPSITSPVRGEEMGCCFATHLAIHSSMAARS